MAFKIILAAFFVLTIMGQGCYAGKGFSGGGSIGLINQLRTQLIVAQRRATLALKTSNTTITNNIATAQNRINQELLAAQKAVDAANNPSCANQFNSAVSQVNSDNLNNCDQSAELEAVQAQVALLAGLHAQISQVYILCPFWPPADQSTCIQDFSVGITEQITELSDSITTAIDDAVSASAECVDSASQEASQVISDARAAFNECVRASVS